MPDEKKNNVVKPYHSETLDEIRKQIDALDNRIHDTLMERAELIQRVSEEKRKKNIQIVQPAREARMIRRLLARHNGVLPEMAVVRIWRELVGAVSLLQTGLRVGVVASEGQNEFWDLARDYFGSCLPMQRMASPVSAIAAVKEKKTTFAVLPYPREDDEQPWWAYLGANTPEALQIIIRLPHGDDPENLNPDCRALVVSQGGFDASGDDRSFLLIQCDQQISRARLVDLARKSELTATAMYSRRINSPMMPALHLMEVEDYVANGDKRLENLIKAIDDPGASISCVGGYPVPPVYSKNISASTQKASA